VFCLCNLKENGGIEVRSSGNVVSNSFISESSSSGIRITNDRNIIRGNTIVDISGKGIIVDQFTGLSDTQVLDNRVFSSSEEGIFNFFPLRTIIRGNIINGNAKSGINDFTGDDTIIDSNTVTNNGADGGSFVGGIVLGSLGGTTVTVTNNVAVGNDVNGTIVNFLNVRDGVNAIVAGNIFETQQ